MDLSKFNLFEGLSAKDFEQILPLLKEKAVSKGDSLFRQGDIGDGMYFIVEGSCRIELTMSDGRKHIVAELTKGELIGEMAIITRAPRSGDCFFCSDGRLWHLSTEDFDLLQKLSPSAWLRIVENIGKLLCGRLTAMTDEVCKLLRDLSGIENDVSSFERKLAQGKKGLLEVFLNLGKNKSSGIPSLKGGKVGDSRE